MLMTKAKIRLIFSRYNIMFINCLGYMYDFNMYGAFEFLCISFANL